MVARTPSVVVVIWPVVVGVGTRLVIYAFFDVHAGRYVVVVVMVLNDPRRRFANNFPTFKIVALSKAGTIRSAAKEGVASKNGRAARAMRLMATRSLIYPAPNNAVVSPRVAETIKGDAEASPVCALAETNC